MKTRDVFFFVVLLIVAGLVFGADDHPERTRRTFLDRVSRAVAAWWLFGDAAPMPAPQYEQLPPAIANQQEPREAGPDGVIALRHGSGW